MKKYLPFLFVAFVAVLPGCYLLDVKTDPVSGKEMTNLEAIAGKVSTGIATVSPVVNTFVPGTGTIAATGGGILSLIGGLVTSIVVARRRGNQIKEIARGFGYDPYAKTGG